MSELRAGRLLVASPSLTDPNFHKTVVLLCAHGDEGAFGVVLNRPVWEAEVASVLPGWGGIATAPAILFRGGPVEPSAAVALAKIEGSSAPGWSPVFARVGLMSLTGEEMVPLDDVSAFRLFGGYSGWGAGQLEAEIAQEAWFVIDPIEADVFSDSPETLWRDVLRRQPGKLAMFAYFPDDLRLN